MQFKIHTKMKYTNLINVRVHMILKVFIYAFKEKKKSSILGVAPHDNL